MKNRASGGQRADKLNCSFGLNSGLRCPKAEERLKERAIRRQMPKKTKWSDTLLIGYYKDDEDDDNFGWTFHCFST